MGMMSATQHALETFRKLFPQDPSERIVILGSVHDIPIHYERKFEWFSRLTPKENVNFRIDDINQENWNVIINCCCEHMVHMKEITLKGIYVLQSNDRYKDTHINRCLSIKEFRDQCGLDEIYYEDTREFGGANYFTIIGEKW
jgi:hypothetical protein